MMPDHDRLLMGVGWFAAFEFWNAATWSPAQYCAWAVAVVSGLELEAIIASRLPPLLGFAPNIPVRGIFPMPFVAMRRARLRCGDLPHGWRTFPVSQGGNWTAGKHLDELSTLDRTFIWINRLWTCLFAYHTVRYCWVSERIKWGLEDATLGNTVVAYALLFIVYDLVYTNFHRLLHIRSLYRFIHKHHHRQKAPSRGTADAINVHPFEFVCGEYNHLLAIYLVPCHVFAAALFVVSGGLLASWNHTRFDMALPWVMWDTKAHDEHHVIPTVNYGQYIMLWDRLLGTYQDPPALRSAKKADAAH